jgi:hypothetical protein
VGAIIIPGVEHTNNNIDESDDLKIYGCYDTVFGRGDSVEQGYAALRYDYLLKNTKDEKVRFEVEWGDGTYTTTDYVTDSIYVPHIFDKSGAYSVHVKYYNEKEWSEPFVVEMIDFYDISAVNTYIEPSIFRPRQKISLTTDLENIGNVASKGPANVVFYHVKNSKEIVIAKSEVGIIKPGDTKTVKASFKWFNDKDQHTILVKVEGLNGERTTVNNIEFGYFTAQGFIKTCLNNLKARVNNFFERFQKD